jgi:peptide/nickel transport system substrate-binding protein
MKASDVAWSLLRAKEQPGVKAYAAPINTAEAIDDYTVKVTLNAPSAPFMTNLATFSS